MIDAPARRIAGAAVSTGAVVAVDGARARVRSPELGEIAATNAAVGYAPAVGDVALLLTDGSGQCFVVGAVRALREVDPPSLDVCHEHGVTRVSVEGDLELAAPHGAVRIAGADGVLIDSARDVALRAERALSLESHDGERTRSALRLDGDAAALEAGVLAARAARLVVLAEELSTVAKRADARIDEVRTVATRIETRVDTLIERAKESYRETEGLAQTRAGRLRLVASGSLTALAERTKLKAKAVFAIDGESIHLG